MEVILKDTVTHFSITPSSNKSMIIIYLLAADGLLFIVTLHPAHSFSLTLLCSESHFNHSVFPLHSPSVTRWSYWFAAEKGINIFASLWWWWSSSSSENPVAMVTCFGQCDTQFYEWGGGGNKVQIDKQGDVEPNGAGGGGRYCWVQVRHIRALSNPLYIYIFFLYYLFAAPLHKLILKGHLEVISPFNSCLCWNVQYIPLNRHTHAHACSWTQNTHLLTYAHILRGSELRVFPLNEWVA